jgi:hypothetical protein
MMIKLVALAMLCLMTDTAVAQEPKVTSLMSKDLPESPGRDTARQQRGFQKGVDRRDKAANGTRRSPERGMQSRPEQSGGNQKSVFQSLLPCLTEDFSSDCFGIDLAGPKRECNSVLLSRAKT